MPIYKTEAFVLARRDFGETSLIVEFFTYNFGRLNGILKGIRKEPQKFNSHLEPFSYNEIVFYKKRNTELHLVSQCDMKDDFGPIRQNIRKINVATLMMELTRMIMPLEDKNEAVFNLILDCLNELKNNSYPDKIGIIFKIKLLALSGFKPHLDSCVNCKNRILEEAKFSYFLGGLLCNRCLDKDKRAYPIYRGTIASILHIERNDFTNAINLGLNIEVKKQLETVLNSFLRFHLEKEPKTQKIIEEIDKSKINEIEEEK